MYSQYLVFFSFKVKKLYICAYLLRISYSEAIMYYRHDISRLSNNELIIAKAVTASRSK